mgnify:CR=1 FL=1
MSDAYYIASVINAEGTDVENVDLRDLPPRRLAMLRSEAAVVGDLDMVRVIDDITAPMGPGIAYDGEDGFR